MKSTNLNVIHVAAEEKGEACEFYNRCLQSTRHLGSEQTIYLIIIQVDLHLSNVTEVFGA